MGPEIMHAALSRELREALYLALSGLVRDGMVGQEDALSIGARVLRDNAARLLSVTETAGSLSVSPSKVDDSTPTDSSLSQDEALRFLAQRLPVGRLLAGARS